MAKEVLNEIINILNQGIKAIDLNCELSDSEREMREMAKSFKDQKIVHKQDGLKVRPKVRKEIDNNVLDLRSIRTYQDVKEVIEY